eukprot:521810_1
MLSLQQSTTIIDPNALSIYVISLIIDNVNENDIKGTKQKIHKQSVIKLIQTNNLTFKALVKNGKKQFVELLQKGCDIKKAQLVKLYKYIQPIKSFILLLLSILEEIPSQTQIDNEIIVRFAIDNKIDLNKFTAQKGALENKMTNEYKLANAARKRIKHIFNKLQQAITDQSINIAAIHEILMKHSIHVQVEKLTAAFIGYNNNKNQFISDMIDACYSANDETLPISNKISINYLPQNCETRHQIYENILYKYIKKEDLNNENFVKIATVVINILHIDVDIDQFKQYVNDKRIDGKLFCSFKNKLVFAKMFRQINGYKKKQFASIYDNINSWNLIQTTAKSTVSKQNDIENNEEQNKVNEFMLMIKTIIAAMDIEEKCEENKTNMETLSRSIISNGLNVDKFRTWNRNAFIYFLENKCNIQMSTAKLLCDRIREKIANETLNNNQK